jgi:uncharacterized protein (DUF433 family)
MATATNPVYAHIVKQPGYCGGKAAIDDTRIRVNNVVFLHKEGKTPQEILGIYPDLGLSHVHAALTYYYDHTAEIEATNDEDQEVTADRWYRAGRLFPGLIAWRQKVYSETYGEILEQFEELARRDQPFGDYPIVHIKPRRSPPFP